MLNQVAGWQQIVERMHKCGRRAAMIECYAARNVFQVWLILDQSIEQTGDRCFAFADQHAIDSACGVPQDFFGNKRNAVSTNTNECFRQQGARSAGEIEDFRNVSQVIDGERDDVWPPAFDQTEKILIRFALQVDQTNRVTCASCGCGYKFETERF